MKKEFRHPKGVESTQSFVDDSARRDLTINSLGLTKDGEIVDYQGGVEDLKNKLVRAVGEPKQRFEEDALRLIRTMRFAAKLGFAIEPKTLQAAKELNHLIDTVSVERVHDELFKVADGGGSALANFIEHMDESGMLERVLPEIKVLQGMEQPKEHHPEGDAYQHTLAALRTSRSKDPLTNLAIMFHDIGKNKEVHKVVDGRSTYFGHHSEGAKLFDKIADRLKFSNDEREAIKFVIDNHMLGYQMKQGMKKSTMLAMRNSPYWEHLKECFYADIMSRGIPSRIDDFNEIVDKLDHIQKVMGEKEAFEKKMSALVDGRFIMNLIPGIIGQDIGTIKNQTREWIVKNDFKVSKDQVADYIKKAGMML